MAEDSPEDVQVAEASEEALAEEVLAEAEADQVEADRAEVMAEVHHTDHHTMDQVMDHIIHHQDHHITTIIIHITDQELHIIVEEAVQEAVAQHFS